MANKMKYAFVVNRNAGKGSAVKKWTALEARVAELFDDYSVVYDLAPIAADADVVVAVGGDGTVRGAAKIANEVKKRGLAIAVAVVPKTIDNDVPLLDRTFGFETAVATAAKLLQNYKGVLSSYFNAVGFVKLMGRECGFIATKAAFLSKVVDIVLIPEEEW